MKVIPEIHEKRWGREIWVANSSAYCGKILVFEEGKFCSYHYHRLKSEHFMISKGTFMIKYGETDDIGKANAITLKEGECFFVPAGMRHQMTAITAGEIIEFSTQHFEEDSYRIIPSI